MCGLAGFVRHPDAPKSKARTQALSLLATAAQKRGKHATGFAILNGKGGTIKKWAMPLDEVVSSGMYGKELAPKIHHANTCIVHTRHATLPNKTDDAAAHPFNFNGTIGCHNGTIVNWREIQRDNQQDGWITDSQAAIWALSEKDPSIALQMLDGWWALAWTRGGILHLTRTVERPLACAYAADIQTLFWGSIREDVQAAMRQVGLKFTSWELNPDTIYSFDPMSFGEKASPVKEEVELDRPSSRHATKRDEYQAEIWDASRVGAKRTWVDELPNRRPRTMAQFMNEIDSEVYRVEGLVNDLQEQVNELEDKLRSAYELIEILIQESK